MEWWIFPDHKRNFYTKYYTWFLKKKLEEGEGETHPGKKRSVSCEAVITKTCYFFWFDGRSMGISIPPR